MHETARTAAHAAPVTLVDNRGRVRLLTVVNVFLILAGLALVGVGVNVARTYGLSPFDGGVLRPLGQRLALGGGLALFGLAIIAGMQYYLSRYVVTMTREGDDIHLVTASRFFGRDHSFPASDTQGITAHSGRAWIPTRGIRVDAPWLTLRVARRGRFIIDTQARTLNLDALAALLPGAH